MIRGSKPRSLRKSSQRRGRSTDEKGTAKFAGMCLLARRMVERGVRFAQLISTAGTATPDAVRTASTTREIDRPIGKNN